ncbi:Beta-1,2-xylosyltransferase [Drechslerella dactyloides]|uniref:Beta-1,2-xylosyltransferase n=1 Tax=Drechslerella dactyloides TaxID=74499 RepID=A0AAD6IZ55_DREDA|nr:Beta-1,2-xylosyltransferase [Drechslerella dactyloides]
MISSKTLHPQRVARHFGSLHLLCLLVVGVTLIHLRASVYDTISGARDLSSVSTIFKASHPIERLILQYEQNYKQFVERQSKTPEEAITAYKKRYNRNPPPGFSKWVRYALAHNSTVIDDYDRIEEKIAQFRTLSPFDLQRRIKIWQKTARSFGTVKIQDGRFIEGEDRVQKSLADIVDQLPDVEFLYSWLDEPRIIGVNRESNKADSENMGGKNAWPLLTEKCNFPSEFQAQRRWEGRTEPKFKYVEDLNESLDVCRHPEYQHMHGFFNSPTTLPAVRSLIPLFSGAALSTMSDIITPGLDYIAPGYLGDSKTFDAIPYSEKKTQMYWKAWSTGSSFREESYRFNHRVRFVQRFGTHPMFHIGFSRYVQCGDFCPQLEKLVGIVPNDDSKVGFQYKFAMDIDGNGYSGRYYRLLHSNCLVFKQTMWQQWHDDRLMPWVHYIPVSMSMDELESMVNYFANDTKGQVYGEKIAEAGRTWAEKSLRPIDITIYTYRQLLEYANLFKEDTGSDRRTLAPQD